MILLPVTLATASILGLLYVALSAAVSIERGRAKVGLGTGAELSVALGSEHEAPRLLVAIRRHGHFAEYVPISIVLIALLELAQANRNALIGLATALIVSRVMIVFGIGRSAPNFLRAGGNMVQWLVIVVASLYGLYVLATG